MKELDWVRRLNPGRDPLKRCIRVGRLSGVRRVSQVFSMCSFDGKVSLLHGLTRKYDAEGDRSRLEVGLAGERELVEKLRREGWIVANKPPREDWKVYVIEVDPVVRRHGAVVSANPDANPALPCLYIGQTGREIEERFREHQTGMGEKKGGRFLKGNCLRLRPDVYDVFNPMPQLESLVLERELAIELRAEGHTVLGGH